MRRRRQQDNSSYLSDLAFLLIIFFILLAGSTTIRELSTNLSDGTEATAPSIETTTFTVHIAEDGTWAGNDGDIITPETLQMRIQRETSEVSALYLIINPAATWQQVTPLLALGDEQGIPVFMEESL